MKDFFLKLGRKLRAFLHGRYGFDELSNLLSVLTVIFVLLTFVSKYFGIAAWALLLWSLFRTYSRNITARSRERAAYLRFRNKIRDFFKLRKNKFRDRKTHKYYKCPGCKATLRVPRGKGKIEITCPKCRRKFIKKT